MGFSFSLLNFQCGTWDLNPHASRHKNLNLACLPIPSVPLMSHMLSSALQKVNYRIFNTSAAVNTSISNGWCKRYKSRLCLPCCLQKRSRQMYPQSLLHFRKLHKHSIQEISGQIKKNPWKQRKVISGKKSRIRETKKRHKESPIQDFRHPSKIK